MITLARYITFLFLGGRTTWNMRGLSPNTGLLSLLTGGDRGAFGLYHTGLTISHPPPALAEMVSLEAATPEIKLTH